MKLSRTLVIGRLKSRITEIDKAAKRGEAVREANHKKAVRAFNRLPRVTEETTYKQLTHAANLLREVMNNHDDKTYYRAENKSYQQRQIEREISLLELSSDEHVTVRNNSSLADFITP